MLKKTYDMHPFDAKKGKQNKINAKKWKIIRQCRSWKERKEADTEKGGNPKQTR